LYVHERHTSLDLFSVPLLFFHSSAHPRDLHSFPTRRSSDLVTALRRTSPPSLRGGLFARRQAGAVRRLPRQGLVALGHRIGQGRSEEHTSELQSRSDLVCRLLLEKKNNKN